MAYGKIYQTSFDSYVSERYRLDIYKKDFDGGVTNIICADIAVQQKLQDDDRYIPVRGGALEITMINEEGSLPLPNFFSVEDNVFLVDLFWGNKKLFTGFILQSDCDEIQADYTHPISLTVVDNMALLKDISLGQSAALFGTFVEYDKMIDYIDDHTIRAYFNPILINQGDTIVISNSGDPRDGTYLVTKVSIVSSVTIIEVAETVLPWVSSASAHLKIITPVDLLGKLTLGKIIRLCLLSTLLEINTQVYANIIYEGATTGLFLDETLTGTEVFSQGNDSWDDCYTVLEKIMKRFNASIFQSSGLWTIQRWDELRLFDNATTGWMYDPQMDYQSSTFLTNVFEYGQTNNIEQGLTAAILRPYKLVEETFNYQQPVFIRNQDLRDVGTLLLSTTGTVDGEVIRADVYEFPASSQWVHVNNDASVIVVLTQILGQNEIEKERYVYQPKINNGFNFANVLFNDIEVSKGDRMDFSFSIKCNTSTGGDSVKYRVGASIKVAPGSYYNLVNGLGFFNWLGGGVVAGSEITAVVGPNEATDYYSYVMSSFTSLEEQIPVFPVDGILQIYVYGTNDSNTSQPDVDAIWNNINLTITNYITDNTIVKGHVHTDAQSKTINNRSQYQIFIDDSPRYTIRGTLFKQQIINLLRQRTFEWNYLRTSSEKLRLGQLITQEIEYQNRVPRTKLIGTFKGLTRTRIYNYTGVVTFQGIAFNSYIVFDDANVLDFPIGAIVQISGTLSNDGAYPILTSVQFLTKVVITVIGSFIYEGPEPATAIVTFKYHVQPNMIVRYANMPGKNFITGLLTIDYKNDTFSCTLYEQYVDGEDGVFPQSYYSFKYLYQK